MFPIICVCPWFPFPLSLGQTLALHLQTEPGWIDAPHHHPYFYVPVLSHVPLTFSNNAVHAVLPSLLFCCPSSTRLQLFSLAAAGPGSRVWCACCPPLRSTLPFSRHHQVSNVGASLWPVNCANDVGPTACVLIDGYGYALSCGVEATLKGHSEPPRASRAPGEVLRTLGRVRMPRGHHSNQWET